MIHIVIGHDTLDGLLILVEYRLEDIITGFLLLVHR
jgi:hypothetical protein